MPTCPVCGEGELRLADYIAFDGLRYKAHCDACGIVMEHRSFYGINSVEKFFENAGRGECENEGCTMQFVCSKCGCDVSGGDELGHNSNKGEFNYCPNCGFEVQR